MRYHQTYESEKAEVRRIEWSLLVRLMGYLRPYAGGLCLAVALLIVAKGIEAYVPIYLGRVTQKILTGFSLDAPGKASVLHEVLRDSFHIFVLLCMAYVIDTGSVVLKNWIGQKGLYRLRQDVYAHIQRMPLAYFNKSRVGSLMTRTIHDVNQINQMFAESVVPMIGSLILLFGICIGLVVVDWRLALLLGAFLPVIFFLTNHFRINQRRCYDMIRRIVSAMNAFVQEHLMGASIIRSFGLQHREKEVFEKINEDHREANMETIHYFAAFFAQIDFMQTLALVAVFTTLILTAPAGAGFNAGAYFTFSLYILMVFRPLADFAERYNVLQSAMAAADRIFDVLDRKPEDQKRGKVMEITEVESIAFEDVWFAYQGENWILKGLSLQVNKGESMALVGFTGAGKTTVLSLLLRFYDVQKGAIKVNGRDIRDYPLHVVRSLFSVVFQDPEIFSGTLFDNVALDNPLITREKIEQVFDYLQLRTFLDRLPDGFDQMFAERGKSLSAGERQLVSLARAVAHNREFLVLDEATANIDTMTERMIQRALKKVLRDKTSIVIAHRLSTILDVDNIVVLHEGKVWESGRHQELLAGKGIYEKLYRLQFLQ